MSQFEPPEYNPHKQPFTQILVIGLLSIVANLSNGIYPVFVSAMLTTGKITTSQMGVVATAEFLPFGLATMLAGSFLPERNLRSIAGACLIVQLLAALATPSLGYLALLPVRALYGISGGTLLWLTYAFLARSIHPGRLVGIYTTVLMVIAVALSRVIPELILPSFGPAGTIVFLAMPAVPALLLISLCPNQLEPLESTGDDGAPARSAIPFGALMVLLSVGVWSAFMSIFWVYSDPISSTFKDDFARYWLTVSLVFQILGAASAAFLAERLSNRMVITTGHLLSIAAVASILVGTSSTGFVFWTAIYGFQGYFLAPFYVAELNEVDPSRRSMVFYPAAQFLAGSLGPLVVSQIISDTDLHAGLVVDLVCISLAPVALWIGILSHARHRAAAGR